MTCLHSGCFANLKLTLFETDFGYKHNIFASGAKGLTQDFLCVIWSIDLGCIYKRYASIDGEF